ncbi:MAG: sialidase family protein, partial [Gaiellales bacterium]
MRRRLVGLAVCVAVVALIVLLALASGNDRSGASGAGNARAAPSEHAPAPARPAGAVSVHPARGWAGEAVVDRRMDDWEPAVAADPHGGRVYLMTTRYGGPRACHTCPAHQIMVLVSRDNGRSFGPARYLCACPGVGGQNDPQVEVDVHGTVYAVWMNDYDPGVVFARSTDHGATWTRPLAVRAAGMRFTDKPILAVSPSGRDVYIAFNSSDSYVLASHDGGTTFSQPVRTNRDGRYYFAGGGFVAPNGTATFGETSYTQSSTGPVRILVMRSTDGGATWRQTEIDRVQQQPTCVSRGCPAGFYGP